MSKSSESLNHLSELSTREEPFEVLGEDKGTLLLIPPSLISPTEGAVQYLIRDRQAKKNNGTPTRRFQLCCMFRSGSCTFGMYCGYIHSKHVLDAELAPLVRSSPVHERHVIHSIEDAPYKRHDEGYRLLIFDTDLQTSVEVLSEHLYQTEGSIAALDAQAKQRSSGGSAPVPAASRLCHFFEQNFCGRGESCKYIHRVPLARLLSKPKPNWKSPPQAHLQQQHGNQPLNPHFAQQPPPPPPPFSMPMLSTNYPMSMNFPSSMMPTQYVILTQPMMQNVPQQQPIQYVRLQDGQLLCTTAPHALGVHQHQHTPQ